MPAPEYREELRQLKFPTDVNARPAAVLYVYDPATGNMCPASSVGVTGSGQVLNTNLVGGVMQVENLHVEMDSTGLHNVAGTQINPSTEDTLQDILETLGGVVLVPKSAGLSIFNTTAITAGAGPAEIVSYTVPVGKRFRITGARGWADVDGEFTIAIDGDQVDGYRTTPAELTMNINAASIQYVAAGSVITIAAAHYKSGPAQTFKAAIQGSLETL